MRQQDQSNLFISIRKPHKPVTSGHWLKRVMKLAGINTEVYSAHSNRGVPTSKVKAEEVPMLEILKAANWSSS